MNNDAENIVKRLSFENIIWITFIVISVLDIYGDELLRKNILYNDQKSANKANTIFLIATGISLLIYAYFLYRNYKDYEKYRTKSYEIRLTGSILVLSGVICLLYFQLTTRKKNDSPSNV